jgi:SRSO17 transposase
MSVEPMNVRVQPQKVRSAHQSMHHLVAQSDGSDRAMLATVAGTVVPVLSAAGVPCFWIIDDTGGRK